MTFKEGIKIVIAILLEIYWTSSKNNKMITHNERECKEKGVGEFIYKNTSVVD